MRINDFKSQVNEKIRFRDVDQQGHVNNAVFSTYLEIGRTTFMYSQPPLHDDGCTFVIARIEMDYLKEIKWPGQVDIGSSVTSIGNSSFNVEQAIFSGDQLVAKANTVIVQVNKLTRTSQALSKESKEKISAYKAE